MWKDRARRNWGRICTHFYRLPKKAKTTRSSVSSALWLRLAHLVWCNFSYEFHRLELMSKNSILSIKLRCTLQWPFQHRQSYVHSLSIIVRLTYKMRQQRKATVLQVLAYQNTENILAVDIVYEWCFSFAEANPNGHQESDMTPLHIAAERGDTNVVNMLLEIGANQLIRNARGQLPRGKHEIAFYFESWPFWHYSILGTINRFDNAFQTHQFLSHFIRRGSLCR